MSFWYFFLMQVWGDWTQDLVHIKHMLHHWAIAIPPPPPAIFLFVTLLTLLISAWKYGLLTTDMAQCGYLTNVQRINKWKSE